LYFLHFEWGKIPCQNEIESRREHLVASLPRWTQLVFATETSEQERGYEQFILIEQKRGIGRSTGSSLSNLN
jgi:hypothetical protein